MSGALAATLLVGATLIPEAEEIEDETATIRVWVE